MFGGMQIDHDPDEPPPDRSGNTVYWASFAALAVICAGYFFYNTPDWWALAVGCAIGLFVAIWAIAITGNKVPKWMR
jgi:membrane protein YdbS with pleckstrin-like domain